MNNNMEPVEYLTFTTESGSTYGVSPECMVVSVERQPGHPLSPELGVDDQVLSYIEVGFGVRLWNEIRNTYGTTSRVTSIKVWRYNRMEPEQVTYVQMSPAGPRIEVQLDLEMVLSDALKSMKDQLAEHIAHLARVRATLAAMPADARRADLEMVLSNAHGLLSSGQAAIEAVYASDGDKTMQNMHVMSAAEQLGAAIRMLDIADKHLNSIS